jgi:tetratricopeptide (TPR) repeat protein
MERLERGEADEHEEGRLLDMVLAGPLGPQGERSLSWIAVGDLMLARGQPEQARHCAERALACEPAPTQDEAARARLLRARAALQAGDLPSADEDVASLERLGLADRVDVRLVRAAVLRARNDHEAALKRYQEVVRALDAERPAPWWEAVEGIAGVYVDMKDWPQARRFLADLNRRDPTFGGDAVRKRRLVSLMGWLDAQR